MNANQNLHYPDYLGKNRISALLTYQAAASLFDRALSQGLRRRLWSKLTGRSSALQTLNQHSISRAASRSNRITFVPLDQIVGSESRSKDFDRYFNPLKTHHRDRWIGIAVAIQKGVALPPVELVQEGECFYVRDGHHRISVARSRGQMDIEARIVN